MKTKMPGSVSRWQRNGRWFIGRQHALLGVEFPDKNLVEAQVHVQHETSGRIGLNHVGMRPVVSTEGEAARRRAFGSRWPKLPGVVLDIRGRLQMTVGIDRQHGDRAAKIVGHEEKSSRRMKADISWPRPARRNRAQEL